MFFNNLEDLSNGSEHKSLLYSKFMKFKDII